MNFDVMQLVSFAKNGGNPDALIHQMLNTNPQLQQLIGGKTPQQLMQTAENMCRERGTTVDAVLRQYGLNR